MIRYHEDLFDCEAVRIVAGEYFVTSEDLVISTLLGSCVAACVRDEQTGIVGMNHFMLPAESGPHAPQSGASYGIPAMNRLIAAMCKRGANERTMVAKVFGGGIVMGENPVVDVGRLNAEFVVEYLRRRRIDVAAADLRGSGARKIYFVQQTGRVFVHHLRRRLDDESRDVLIVSGKRV